MGVKASVEPKWITHREAAGLVSMDTETIRGWVRSGEWPEPIAIIRQTWFYKKAWLDQFLASGTWPDDVKFKPGEGKGREAQ